MGDSNDAVDASEAAAVERSVTREARLRLVQLAPLLAALDRDLAVLAPAEAPPAWRSAAEASSSSTAAARYQQQAWGQLSIPDAGTELAAAIAAAQTAAGAAAGGGNATGPEGASVGAARVSGQKRSRWGDAGSGGGVATSAPQVIGDSGDPPLPPNPPSAPPLPPLPAPPLPPLPAPPLPEGGAPLPPLASSGGGAGSMARALEAAGVDDMEI
jgi:hypothetical protein